MKEYTISIVKFNITLLTELLLFRLPNNKILTASIIFCEKGLITISYIIKEDLFLKIEIYGM